jgi:hypothetical protein
MCFGFDYRSAKPRNRPSFRQILMHLEIASPELLNYNRENFVECQVNTCISPVCFINISCCLELDNWLTEWSFIVLLIVSSI